MNTMLPKLSMTHNLIFNLYSHAKCVHQSDKWRHILHKAKQQYDWHRLVLLDSYFELQKRTNYGAGFVTEDPLIPLNSITKKIEES